MIILCGILVLINCNFLYLLIKITLRCFDIEFGNKN